ncbi:MAG: tetratricopeptide repeat protein [Pseudolabrys sp.]|jgi:tetratricopeptide (TPR) repeat protein
MPIAPSRALILAGAGLMLAACNTTGDRLADNRPSGTQALAMVPPPDVTGSIGTHRKGSDAEEARPANPAEAAIRPAPVLPGDEPEPGSSAGNAGDAIAEGRAQYRANHFREAERHFRRATQIDPQSSEAWVGLAASHDRLRDFPQADRAYARALTLGGPTSELLNNQGYSYMLRGDLKNAREKLLAAQRVDPRNKYVANNLVLLESNERKSRR